MRRALCAVGTIAFVSIVVLAPNARANQAGWSASGWDPSPTDQTYTTAPTLSGHFSYDNCDVVAGCFIDIVSSHITLQDGQTLPDTCTPPPDTYDTYTTPRGSTAYQAFALTPEFACNGVYDIEVDAHQKGTAFTSDGFHLSATGFTIAIPADAPKSVTAKVTDSDIAVSWVGPDVQQPDFLGYQVSRYDAAGHETVVVAGPTTSGSLVDQGVGGGAYTYGVRSMRSGAAPSAAAASSKVTVAGPPDTSTGSDGSSSDGSSSDPGSAPGGGTIVLGPTGGGVGGATVVHVPTGKSSAGGGSGGSSATGSGEGVLADEGFSTDLPYEPEPGELEAARPTVRTADDPPGAALLIPGAVASVLFVWATLILFVTRQARWADAGLLPVEVEYER